MHDWKYALKKLLNYLKTMATVFFFSKYIYIQSRYLKKKKKLETIKNDVSLYKLLYVFSHKSQNIMNTATYPYPYINIINSDFPLLNML